MVFSRGVVSAALAVVLPLSLLLIAQQRRNAGRGDPLPPAQAPDCYLAGGAAAAAEPAEWEAFTLPFQPVEQLSADTLPLSSHNVSCGPLPCSCGAAGRGRLPPVCSHGAPLPRPWCSAPATRCTCGCAATPTCCCTTGRCSMSPEAVSRSCTQPQGRPAPASRHAAPALPRCARCRRRRGCPSWAGPAAAAPPAAQAPLPSCPPWRMCATTRGARSSSPSCCSAPTPPPWAGTSQR